MNFDESVNYLLSLGNEVLAMKLGLENIGKLLAALDNPQNNYYKVQVAGTNGKGSTCAFLEGICLAAGVKTGLFTSPHLISITERVSIDGEKIGEAEFARIATKIRETSEQLVEKGELENVPTFFEQVTAIALYAFAEAGVELAILETGLGGRLDATTAAKAEIAVITRIDYDHQDILGNTLAEIAAEKAAIIRPGSLVALAPQRPEAIGVIRKVCDENGVMPYSDFKAEITRIEKYQMLTVNFETPKGSYPDNTLGLRGRHQIENAGTAILAAELLPEGFGISEDSVWGGLATPVYRGRLEFFWNIILDGAHNASGASALVSFLDEFVDRPVTLVFGAARDKDLAEITRILFPRAANLVLTRFENSRSVESSELAKYARGVIRADSLFETENIRDALEVARRITYEEDIICVTGSLYLVGEALKLLNNEMIEKMGKMYE